MWLVCLTSDKDLLCLQGRHACQILREKEFEEIGVQQNKFVTFIILVGSYFIAEDVARVT